MSSAELDASARRRRRTNLAAERIAKILAHLSVLRLSGNGLGDSGAGVLGARLSVRDGMNGGVERTKAPPDLDDTVT